MRKDSKRENRVQVTRVQGYHEGSWGEEYAFSGFEFNKYFSSDRYIKLDENFQRKDGQPLQGFGLEIETECESVNEQNALAAIMKDIVFKPFPNDLFKMQEDGSLGHRNRTRIEMEGGQPVLRRYDPEKASIGVECITQVMTKLFIRNHYKDFKTMYNTYFPAFEISCSKSGRCGMHVNISNALFGKTIEQQKDNIRKLYYFVNNNFSLACRLFKRDETKTGYCERMQCDSIEQCKRLPISGGSHYVCFNFSHFDFGRIELRLVGGQPDYYAFRNTMETIFFLVERMNKIEWKDLDDLVKVFEGCNQYVFKRLQDCFLTVSQMEEIKGNLKHEDLELER